MNSRLSPTFTFQLILAVVYFIAGKLGLTLAFVNASATAVWPPTGIALAAMILSGYRVWPSIFVAAFLVNLTTAGSVATSLCIAAGNTLEGVVGAYLVNMLADGLNAFFKAQNIFKFVVLAAGISTIVSATIGVTSLCLFGFAAWESYGSIWQTWWFGDAVGALIVAPLIVLWAVQPRLRWKSEQVIESSLLLTLLIAVSQLVFGKWYHATGLNYPLSFLCVPFLAWSGFRFGLRETATTSAILSAIAIWGTLRGTGPFVMETQNQSLLVVQAFTAINTIMALVLASVVTERRKIGEELQRAHNELEERVRDRTKDLFHLNQTLQSEVVERKRAEEEREKSQELYRHLVDNANDIIYSVDTTGSVIFFNPVANKVLGYNHDEMMGRNYLEFVKPEYRDSVARFFKVQFSKKIVNTYYEAPVMTKDGRELWFGQSVHLLVNNNHINGFQVISRDITEQKRLQRSLDEIAQQRTDDLLKFATSVQHAQEEERRRIARELHDDLGQRLSGMKLNIEVFEDTIPKHNAKTIGKLKHLKTQINTMITEIRRLSSNLHPAALDDFGLAVALQLLCKEFEKVQRIKITIFTGQLKMERFHPDVEITLYRIVQEALSNIAKHAEASNVTIRLHQDENNMYLVVQDNGKGFDLAEARAWKGGDRGLGLISMKERTEYLGGRYRIESQLQQGTTINVELPIRR